MPLLVPPPTCGSVACAPAVPAYTVNNLTLAFLTAYGFPSVLATVGDLEARGLALDALSRSGQTRVLNDTYNFCQIDTELQQWCGFSTTSPFKYCIVAESWPQADIWGWMQNTTFTSPSSLTPIEPAFCACPVAGRAYYLPSGNTDDDKHYGPHCPVEQTLLAFYIILMVLSACVLVAILYDTGVLFVGTWRLTGEAVDTHTRCSVFMRAAVSAPTLLIKLLMIAFMLVLIATEAMFTAPAGSNTTLLTAKGVMCLMSVILLLFSYSMAVFTYVEILIRAHVFGGEGTARTLRICKWLFFVTNGLCLLSALASTMAFAYNLTDGLDERPPTLAGLGEAGTITTQLGQAIMLIMLCTQAVMMLETLVLLLIVTWSLRRMSRKARGMKDLIKRAAGLWLAWLGGLPNLGLMAAITPIVAWILTGAIPSWWPSHYLSNINYLWCIWGYFMSDLLWIACIAYAMRTRARKGCFEILYSQFVDKKTVMDADTGASGSGTSGSTTGTSSQFSVNGTGVTTAGDTGTDMEFAVMNDDDGQYQHRDARQ